MSGAKHLDPQRGQSRSSDCQRFFMTDGAKGAQESRSGPADTAFYGADLAMQPVGGFLVGGAGRDQQKRLPVKGRETVDSPFNVFVMHCPFLRG